MDPVEGLDVRSRIYIDPATVSLQSYMALLQSVPRAGVKEETAPTAVTEPPPMDL